MPSAVASLAGRRSSEGRFARWGWTGHLLAAALAIPFILHQNAWYEWANSLWALQLQTAHVAAHGLPTYFMDPGGEYFLAQHLFYAGPAFAVLAYPAAVVGAWPVFAACAAGAFAAASAGISWSARNLGVPARWALVPGLLFALTPYVVSNLYGRGDWAELLATGALAVTVGAATSLLTSRRRPAADALVLALAVAVIAGTHNLTLLFGALAAPVLLVALAPVLALSRAEMVRRLGWVLAGVVAGLALCGAFLVPNVWLGGRTVTGRRSYLFLAVLHAWDHPGVIFDPLPGQPQGAAGTDLHTQTLALPLAWVLVCLAVMVARGRLERRRALSGALLVATAALVALLIAEPGWWESFPHVLSTIQFPFRLVTYLSLITVLAIAVLMGSRTVRHNRLAVASLLATLAWQGVIGAGLALGAHARGTRHAPRSSTVRAGTMPASFARGQQGEFRLVDRHPLPYPAARARVAPISDDTPADVHLFGSQPAGSLVRTTVVASPLVRITGDASVAGVTFNGFFVLRVHRSPWRATARPVCTGLCLGHGAPVAMGAGRVVSLAGAVAVLALMLVALRARWRPSNDPRAQLTGSR